MSPKGSNPRVLHVVETLPGGPAAYLNEVLPWQLRRAGAGHIGLLAPATHLDHLSAEARDGLVGFPYARSGRNPQSLLAMYRALWGALDVFRPDLVHAHSSFAGAIARLRRLPVPLVYCSHGWSFLNDSPRIKRRAYAAIERALQSRCDAIIAVSDHERESAIAEGMDAKRIFTVISGLRPLPQPPARQGKTAGPLELLFIGRFDRQKGLDWLLSAMEGLPSEQVRLTVVGAAVVDATSIERPAHVRFVGWLAPDEVIRQLDRADALVVPSRWEAFGLVVLEAMRRGVPVLASNRGALPEVVGEAGLIFDLDRPETLLSLIDQLTPDRLAELGRAGLARFEAKFGAERMNRQTWELYETLCGTS